MTQSQPWQCIPTNLTLEQFEEFVLPYLHIERRGPQPKLSLHAIFNYILKLLYLGCQWKELPIKENSDGQPEIHYTSIYRAFRRFEAHGCFDAIFAGSVSHLHQKEYLDISVIHGDGTTTAAKKGGDNLEFSGHKHLKGDKVVAICDRHCNVIAPFVTAPGNRNESPLLHKALPQVTSIAKRIGLDLSKTTISLDEVYDSRANRKAIFNPWHGTEYSGKSAWEKDSEAWTPAYFHSSHLSGTVSYYRTCLRLGGQVSTLIAAL